MSRPLSENPLMIKREIATMLEFLGMCVSASQYKKRTARELLAVLNDLCAKDGKVVPGRIIEMVSKIRYTKQATDPAPVQTPVNDLSDAVVTEVQGDIALFDKAAEVMGKMPVAPVVAKPLTEKEKAKLEKEKAKLVSMTSEMMSKLGVYGVNYRVQLSTKSQNLNLRDNRKEIPAWLRGAKVLYERARVVVGTSAHSGWDEVAEFAGVRKDEKGYAERISVQSVLQLPKKAKVGNAYVAKLAPLPGDQQRKSLLADEMERKGYIAYGGTGGGVSAFIRMGDEHTGRLYRQVIKALSKGADWTGYLSKYGATARHYYRNVSVAYYDASNDPTGIGGRSEDGGSWGWNPDHPENAGLLQEHGPCIIQFFYGTLDGVYAKGDMPPVNLGENGPRFRIAHNCVKGARKEDIKAAVKGDGRKDENGNFLVILRTSEGHGTQQLGYQWLMHCANVEANRVIAKELATLAVEKIVKAGVEGLLEQVCAQDPTSEVQRQFAVALGQSPLAVPGINNRVNAKLRSRLFEAFASLGIEGQIFELLMDDRMERGTFACASGSKGLPLVGTEGILWRSPHMHGQGNLVLKRTELRNDQKVKINGELVEILGSIFLHPDDVAKIQGDDDGDTVAVCGDPAVIEMALNNQKARGNTLWLFEPTAVAPGETFPHPAAIRDARYRMQGPTGLAAWHHCDAVALRDMQNYESWEVAVAASMQACIDVKKDATLPSVETLMDASAWTFKAAEGGSYPRVCAPQGKDLSPAGAVAAVGEKLTEIKKGLGAGVRAYITGQLVGDEAAAKAKATNPKAIESITRRFDQEWSKTPLKDANGKVMLKPDGSPVGYMRGDRPQVIKDFSCNPRIWGSMDFTAWKWHGRDIGKNQVDPLNWNPCGTKDNGFGWFRESGGLHPSATLVHFAHDVACRIWREDGADIRKKLAAVDHRNFLSFASLFKTKASIEVLEALPSKENEDGLEDIDKKRAAWWTQIPTSLGKNSFELSNGVKTITNRFKNRTQLETYFEAEITKLINASRDAASHTASLGGDDDNGKSAAEVASAFRRWILMPKNREKGGKPRPLTARECLFLAVYHESGSIVDPQFCEGLPPESLSNWEMQMWKKKADKVRAGRTAVVWNLVFPGSPLAEALGCRVEECDMIGVDETRRCVESFGEDNKNFKRHIFLGSESNRKLVLIKLDEMHTEKCGKSLRECKACAMRVKMTLGEDMADPVQKQIVVTEANYLNNTIANRFCLWSPSLDEEGNVRFLGPKETAELLASYGYKLIKSDNGSQESDGTLTVYPQLVPLKPQEIPVFDNLAEIHADFSLDSDVTEEAPEEDPSYLAAMADIDY